MSCRPLIKPKSKFKVPILFQQVSSGRMSSSRILFVHRSPVVPFRQIHCSSNSAENRYSLRYTTQLSGPSAVKVEQCSCEAVPTHSHLESYRPISLQDCFCVCVCFPPNRWPGSRCSHPANRQVRCYFGAALLRCADFTVGDVASDSLCFRSNAVLSQRAVACDGKETPSHSLGPHVGTFFLLTSWSFSFEHASLPQNIKRVDVSQTNDSQNP